MNLPLTNSCLLVVTFIISYVFTCLYLQTTSKKVITRDEWEKRLSDVKVRKEDMNKLVMNFLVTEGYVEAAEKFRIESGTERILLIVFCANLFIFCGSHVF